MLTDDFNDFDDVIAEFFAYDGPHTPDTVAAAAHGLSALVRYLNNATGPGNTRATLRYVATVDRILAGLGGAVHGLDQLLRQLVDAVSRQAEAPALYDDRRDRPAHSTAWLLADRLADMQVDVSVLAREIDAARTLSVHLGNDDATDAADAGDVGDDWGGESRG